MHGLINHGNYASAVGLRVNYVEAQVISVDHLPACMYVLISNEILCYICMYNVSIINDCVR